MPGIIGADSFKYSTNGNGEHNWEVVTQKPFAEFKDEVNQAHDNSWMGWLVKETWKDNVVSFRTRLGDAAGEAKWSSGRVSIVLRITGFPSKQFEQQIVYEVLQMTLRACAYARTAEIEAESKESLRQSALQTYHDAYRNELQAGILIGRWQAVDEVTKVLAALTSSGSAVAGWLVWNNPGWKQSWIVLAGTASVLSIMHVALKVSDRAKDWSDTKGHFVRLRTELETFLYHMKVDPGFSLKEFTAKFEALRTRFGEGEDRKKVDPLSFGIKQRTDGEAMREFEALKRRTDPLPAKVSAVAAAGL